MTDYPIGTGFVIGGAIVLIYLLLAVANHLWFGG
jgi:hypothetical protein